MFRKLKIIKQFLQTKTIKDKNILQKLQQKRLKEFLASLECEFYKDYKNLNDIPIINKKIFMENFKKINTYGISESEALNIAKEAEQSRDFTKQIKNVTVGLSSGTSGNRGIFLVSNDESAKWAGYILKKMLPRPLLQKHKIAFFLRANSNLYESVNSMFIKFSFYDLIKPIKEHIRLLNEQQPTILIAPAKVLSLLAKDENLKINPKKIISVAEVLEDDDKELIFKRFGVTVHQIYQCTEGFLAHTCEYGNLHLNEDILLIEKEWIDKKSNRFSPIITDFNRKTQPVIRYKLDDILILSNEPCKCGSACERIEKIEGRCDDILKMQSLDGEEYFLFPDFIRHELVKNDLNEYKVVKQGDILHIYISPSTQEKNVENSLQNLYKTHKVKPLKHIFHNYLNEPLDIKRRRVRQV